MTTAGAVGSEVTARRLPIGLVVAGVPALATALASTAAGVDGDGGHDTFGLFSSVTHASLGLRWQFALIVVALGAAHYVAAAVAARAASGLPLPLRETLLVQLAAAAANRLTPAGLGGSALNVRYFVRRGMDTRAGVGAVGALAVLGAVADLLALALLVAGAQAFGVGGVHALAALASHVRQLLGPARSPWLWAIVGIVGVAAAVRRFTRGRRTAAPRGRLWVPVRRLLVRPRALGTVMAASASTTVLLGIAFAACAAMVPGPRPAASLATVLIAYMVGAAAGSTVPVPAGLGATEAALAAVLVGLGEPAGHAIQVVIIFRVITFWAPAAVGILAARTLRRRAAL